MIGAILLILAGIATVGLAAKGFSQQGLPLSHTKFIRGKAGKVVGICCAAIALVFFLLAGMIILVGR